MDNSVYQARWLLMPLFCLPVVFFVIGAAV